MVRSALEQRQSRIAAIAAGEGDRTRLLLAQAVEAWRAVGVRVAGVLAEPHGLPGRTCGAGFLRDIASGSPYSIYREAASDPASCHLDAAGVAGAGRAMLDQIASSDVVVLSKFGKLEAMRAGLAPVFDAAIAVGKPLVTTVSASQRDAWRAYAPGAVVLAAEQAALDDWWRAVRGGSKLHA